MNRKFQETKAKSRGQRLLVRSTAVMVLCLLVGCSASAPDDGRSDGGASDMDMAMQADMRVYRPGCSAEDWCWSFPSPQGNTLQAVWASSANDIWAVGEYGAILHYDGNHWQNTQSPTTWSLRAVWGTDSTHVFAAGDLATVLRWDGTRWEQLPVSDTTGMTVKTSGLFGIWGADKDDVWFAGADGVLLHWDGKQVARFANGAQSTLLRALWGTGPRSAYAVGAGGVMLRWDGTKWADFPSMTTEYLTSIWGTSDNNIYVGAASGLIRRWNGTAWSIANNFNNYGIYSIWGTDAANIFAVGDLLLTDPTRRDATKRQATFLKLNGTMFVDVDAANAPKVGLFGLHGTSAQNMIAVGTSGTVVTYTNGTFKSSSNVDVLTGVGGPVTGLTGSSPGDLVAVADWGTTLRYSGGAWSVVASSPYVRFHGLAGAADNLFSAAYDYTPGMVKPLLQKWNGTAWTAETIMGTTAELRALTVSGTSAYAVGITETILKRSGTTWTKQMVNLAGQSTLRGVWAFGDTVWAVGGADPFDQFVTSTYPAKALVSTAGSPFQQMSIPLTDRILYGVWGADTNNVWAVGNEGTIMKWDGTKWALVPISSVTSLRAIIGRSASDIYVAGFAGYLLHFDGTSWTQEDTGTSQNIYNLSLVGKTLYATGSGGMVLKKDLP